MPRKAHGHVHRNEITFPCSDIRHSGRCPLFHRTERYPQSIGNIVTARITDVAGNRDFPVLIKFAYLFEVSKQAFLEQRIVDEIRESLQIPENQRTVYQSQSFTPQSAIVMLSPQAAGTPPRCA